MENRLGDPQTAGSLLNWCRKDRLVGKIVSSSSVRTHQKSETEWPQAKKPYRTLVDFDDVEHSKVTSR